MNLDCVLALQNRGLLGPEKRRLLDIGPQNVYHLRRDQIEAFLAAQQVGLGDGAASKLIDDLIYFSTPRPDEVTTLFSQLAELGGLDYWGIDVCPAPRTRIIDMNFESMPADWVGSFDVVLNFGTTEHIFNQYNSFEMIHDATKVGGVMYHVLPASGYVDHGYFCYTDLFFRDLARANGYEVVDLFLAESGGGNALGQIDLRAEGQFGTVNSAPATSVGRFVPYLNVHALLRKTRAGAFRCGIEVATGHSDIDDSVAESYRTGRRLAEENLAEIQHLRAWVSDLQDRAAESDRLRVERDRSEAEFRAERDASEARLKARLEALLASTSWKVGSALVRPIGRLLRAGGGP